jgi:hypothetical protein
MWRAQVSASFFNKKDREIGRCPVRLIWTCQASPLRLIVAMPNLAL